jgi:pheromone shutdown-related protein TraB
MTISSSILSSAFMGVDVEEKELEELKNKDVLTEVLDELGKTYPVIRERLIHERDLYLMHNIAHCEGDKIVAVVGAGHVPGIQKHWKEDVDLEEISKIPPPSKKGKIILWAIPFIIIAMFIYGFNNEDTGWELIKMWVLVNGSLAALGSLLALAHPLTILVSVIAAPITSLIPVIGVGYVTGLLEAYLRKPQVSDFYSLQDDILSLKGVYKNRVSRILLVFGLSTLGSALGTLLGGSLGAVKTFS